MSDLTFNKVAGAVLATGLAIVGLRELSSGVFTHGPVAKPGYAVQVAEDTGGEAAQVDVPPDWGTVLPKADVNAGAQIFNKCKSCHNADQGGPNQTGPNLWGVVGRKPGSHPGFSYSQAMTDFGAKQPVWDYDHIYMFIKGPQNYLSGTKMTFVGLKQPQDRINVIAYLRQQGGTLPIPAPNPKAAAAAAPGGTPKTTGPSPAPGVGGSTKAPGAAAAGQPAATGSTAKPAAGAGGPAGQGPGAPAQQNTASPGVANSSGADTHKP